MASLLTLFLVAGTGCGNVDDTTPQPANDSATTSGAMGNTSCRTIDHDVVIRTRADLQRFDRLGCFRIQGHLFIRKTARIKNLDALHGLVAVSGYIGIARNLKLRTAYLPNLVKVGQGLVLEGNRELTAIAMPKLEAVGGYLHIFNNRRLKSVSFKRLQKVGGDVIFASNNSLVKLELPCLKWIGGKFIFEHSRTLRYLCLPQLQHVAHSFIVHFNPGLKALLAPNLKYVGRRLEIQRNEYMVKVDLSCLTKVGGNILIVYNLKWSRCQIAKLLRHIDCSGRRIVHDNYAVCRKAHIDPPSWCSTKACRKCRDGHCHPKPGDDDDEGGKTCKKRCAQTCQAKAFRVCKKQGDDVVLMSQMSGDDDHGRSCFERVFAQCNKACYRSKCKGHGGHGDDDDHGGNKMCMPRCKQKVTAWCKAKCHGNGRCMGKCRSTANKWCKAKCKRGDCRKGDKYGKDGRYCHRRGDDDDGGYKGDDDNRGGHKGDDDDDDGRSKGDWGHYHASGD